MLDIFSPFEDLSLDDIGCTGDPWPDYPWLTDAEVEAAYLAMELGLASDDGEQ